MLVTESDTDLDERLGAIRAKSRRARPGSVRMRFTARCVRFDDRTADERSALEED